jgi:hypothetical protein
MAVNPCHALLRDYVPQEGPRTASELRSLLKEMTSAEPGKAREAVQRLAYWLSTEVDHL